MAGRIRSIKPEFNDDEKLGAMSPIDRLLFACSWLLADDYGNFRANPKWIKSQAFCYDESTTVGDVNESLWRLVRAGMYVAYSVRGQSYIHVRNWDKHQKVDRPGKPHCPGPDEDDGSVTVDVGAIRETLAKVPVTPENPRGTLATDRDRDRDREGKGPEEIPPPSVTRTRPRDPLRDQLEGSQPGQRPDVVEVHELWKSTFGKTGAQIGNPSGPLATLIRDAVRDYGLADCLAVVRQAPLDGMVTGKDDERGKRHDDLFYILSQRTFDRLLVASKAPKTIRRREPTASELKQMGRG